MHVAQPGGRRAEGGGCGEHESTHEVSEHRSERQRRTRRAAPPACRHPLCPTPQVAAAGGGALGPGHLTRNWVKVETLGCPRYSMGVNSTCVWIEINGGCSRAGCGAAAVLAALVDVCRLKRPLGSCSSARPRTASSASLPASRRSPPAAPAARCRRRCLPTLAHRRAGRLARRTASRRLRCR